MNIIEAYRALQEGKQVYYHSGHKVVIRPGIGDMALEFSSTSLMATPMALQESSFYIKKQKLKKWRWVMRHINKPDLLSITQGHYSSIEEINGEFQYYEGVCPIIETEIEVEK